MKYNLENDSDKSKFETRAANLLEGENYVELRKISPTRTNQQNRFLHVLISLFAIEIGLTLMEAKTDLKRACEFMRYTKNDKLYLKQTSKMDTKELSEFITWIRNYAGMQGLYLPTSEEYGRDWVAYEREISSHKNYL